MKVRELDMFPKIREDRTSDSRWSLVFKAAEVLRDEAFVIGVDRCQEADIEVPSPALSFPSQSCDCSNCLEVRSRH